MKFNTRKCWNNKNSKKKHRERHRFSLASVWTIFSNQRIVSKVCEFYSKANRNTVRREWKMIKTLWYIWLKFHHSDTTSKAAYEMSVVNLCDKKFRMRFTTFSIKAYERIGWVRWHFWCTRIAPKPSLFPSRSIFRNNISKYARKENINCDERYYFRWLRSVLACAEKESLNLKWL